MMFLTWVQVSALSWTFRFQVAMFNSHFPFLLILNMVMMFLTWVQVLARSWTFKFQVAMFSSHFPFFLILNMVMMFLTWVQVSALSWTFRFQVAMFSSHFPLFLILSMVMMLLTWVQVSVLSTQVAMCSVIFTFTNPQRWGDIVLQPWQVDLHSGQGGNYESVKRFSCFLPYHSNDKLDI